MSWYWWLLLYIVVSYPLCIGGIIMINWLARRLGVGGRRFTRDEEWVMGLIATCSPVLVWLVPIALICGLYEVSGISISTIGRKIGHVTHGDE